MNAWEQFFYNILGGGIVSLLTYISIKLYNLYYARKFRHIFGIDASRQFFLAYGLMNLFPTYNKDGKLMEYPYFKPEVSGSFGKFTPASAAQLRAVQHISQLFGRNIKTPPILVTDVDIQDRQDISYCSVGGLNNLKTIDILEHKENIFFQFDGKPLAILVKSKPNLRFENDRTFDYGFVIKIKPKSLINRTWIGIAGLGEWGTSGAAWFLARNWKSIEKIYRHNSFGLILKVRGGRDESAELIYQSE